MAKCKHLLSVLRLGGFFMTKNNIKGMNRVKFSRGKASLIKDNELSLNQIHHQFIISKEAEGLRDRTIKDHKDHYRYFKKWIDVLYEDLIPSELSIADIREYVSHMKNELGLSPVTINVRLRTLKCFLKFLFEEGYITDNMSPLVKLFKTEVDTIDILTDEHITALIKVINKGEYTGFRDYVLIMLLIDTGMRIGEVTALTSDNIDFQQRTIYLQAKKVKNRRGRFVPLSEKVCKLLFELIKFNEQAFQCKEIFMSVYGMPFQKRSIQKRLKQYKDKVGIKDVRVSPHSFRHYFAKSYILNGGDPFTLQQILGHADLQMVRKYIQMTVIDAKIQHNQFSPLKRLKI
jgi:integrase/recombinase XerD